MERSLVSLGETVSESIYCLNLKFKIIKNLTFNEININVRTCLLTAVARGDFGHLKKNVQMLLVE